MTVATALVGGALGVAGCVGIDQPVIGAIEPAAAARGAIVVVRGEAFCGAGHDEAPCQAPVGGVQFGLEAAAGAAIVSWNQDAIEVAVPEAAPLGATEVIVTAYGRSSNAARFEVWP